MLNVDRVPKPVREQVKPVPWLRPAGLKPVGCPSLWRWLSADCLPGNKMDQTLIHNITLFICTDCTDCYRGRTAYSSRPVVIIAVWRSRSQVPHAIHYRQGARVITVFHVGYFFLWKKSKVTGTVKIPCKEFLCARNYLLVKLVYIIKVILF